MKKYYLILAAVTGLTLVGCTSDDLVVDQMANAYPTEDQPIVFSSLNKGMTRSDFVGKEAADKLGNQFVVFATRVQRQALLVALYSTTILLSTTRTQLVHLHLTPTTGSM